MDMNPTFDATRSCFWLGIDPAQLQSWCYKVRRDPSSWCLAGLLSMFVSSITLQSIFLAFMFTSTMSIPFYCHQVRQFIIRKGPTAQGHASQTWWRLPIDLGPWHVDARSFLMRIIKTWPSMQAPCKIMPDVPSTTTSGIWSTITRKALMEGLATPPRVPAKNWDIHSTLGKRA